MISYLFPQSNWFSLNQKKIEEAVSGKSLHLNGSDNVYKIVLKKQS